MMHIRDPKVRLFVALAAGCVTAAVIASVATILARALWPDYALAEPTKAYTLAMLLARLAAGALSTAGAAIVTSLIARENRRAVWWLGILFVALSLPQHFPVIGASWADYPVWYHFVYLAYLVPIAVLAGKFAGGAQRRDKP